MTKSLSSLQGQLHILESIGLSHSAQADAIRRSIANYNTSGGSRQTPYYDPLGNRRVSPFGMNQARHNTLGNQSVTTQTSNISSPNRDGEVAPEFTSNMLVVGAGLLIVLFLVYMNR